MKELALAVLLAILYCVFLSIRQNFTNKKAKKREEELPNEAKIIECLYNQKCKELHSLGAKIAFFDYNLEPGHIVVLTKKSLIFNNQFVRKYVTPPKTNSSIKFFTNKIVTVTTTSSTKNKSVVGRAVVGGAIAGGAGAVVGAMSGLSDGGKKTVTQTHSHGTDKFHFMISCQNHKFTCHYMQINNKIIEQLGTPKCSINKVDDSRFSNKYYTLFETHRLDDGDLQNIHDFIKNAIS